LIAGCGGKGSPVSLVASKAQCARRYRRMVSVVAKTSQGRYGHCKGDRPSQDSKDKVVVDEDMTALYEIGIVGNDPLI
jgi:hypothetical protein